MARDLRYLVLAEGKFGPMTSKTANGCIRYSPERVVAVLDSTHAGRSAREVIGFGGDIPVVASVEEGMRHGPNALLIGIAPTGGQFPEEWRPLMRAAIANRLEIWSGLHTFIGDDPEFAALAREHGVTIHDLRKPPTDLPVAAGRVRDVAATVVLTVGTDCNIGKMTASLQLRDGLRKRGRRVAFAGTGQTGILIEGWGISVDAVVADFIAGAAERLTIDAAKDADIVLVEGQGSLAHPGYSGVTYGLMHGSLPHAMVMCAQPSRTAINNQPWVKIPPLKEFIAFHERALEPLRPSRTIAVALNTFDLAEPAARDAIARAEDETGLPATDPVRFDPAPIVEAIERFHAARAR
ncbi:MAG: DUF1611 domain-containing protein [Gemmatimonadaceae bacterium]|nr:DUF1611 domain-containing protein [Gemmatimonadaceae bacterium]